MVKDNVQCFREFGWNIAREMPVNGSPTDAFRMERICRRIRFERKGEKRNLNDLGWDEGV